jgi:hypothetical protein
MKNFKVLGVSLLLIVCQNTAANAVEQACVACPIEKSFSEAHAKNHTSLPIYQNTIAEISLSYEGALLAGTIKLDNGLHLHVVDYETVDDNEMKTWSQGDVLLFKVETDSDKGLLLSAKKLGAHGHKTKVEPYLIFDVTKEEKSHLSIVEINDEGKFVKLSDGSVWEFSWFNRFSTKKWDIGQRVIVQGNGEKNSYEFINVSAPTTLRVANAKATFIM